ncbi:MAG: tripartite tricarboxylate transporter substrate binding protein [Proteobacteria bacterium]|nr:tripartite tricarboxylate transporter substrate binding protein [Pseudomonadota bacterium]
MQLCAAISFGVTLPTPIFGQEKWPARPVRVVVPFAPGGTTDLIARVVAGPMSQTLGQQVIVDNRAGAGGALGADIVAKAPKDGYTLAVGTVSTHAIGPALMRSPLYKPDADFTPIAVMATTPIAVFVHRSVGAVTLAELQEKTLAHPGAFNFGSPGNGSLGHLAGLWFNQLAGLDLTHVAYRGSAPALQDLLAGRIHVMFDNIPAALPHIASKDVAAVAVASPSRVSALPDVQTTVEAGFPTFQILTWTMLLAPAGTPAGVVAAANAAVNAALRDEKIRARLAEVSADARGGSPDEAATFLQAELAKWVPIAKGSGASME